VEALEVTKERSFDCILMDLQMPVMDGLEAAEQLRRRGLKIPIIALTANAASSDRRQSLNAGMNDFISKPFQPAALLDRIQRWCGRSSSPPASSVTKLLSAAGDA